MELTPNLSLYVLNSIGYLTIIAVLVVSTIVRVKGRKVLNSIINKVNSFELSITEIKNHLENNIRTELNKILREELTTLDSSTNAEKALWYYMNKKIDDIIKTYTLVKEDIKLINNPQAQNSLLGSGKSELQVAYSYEIEGEKHSFPSLFLDSVDSINDKHLKQLTNSFMAQLVLIDKAEIIPMLKEEIKDIFRKNVRSIYEMFNNTKHLIKDPDYLAVHSVSTPIHTHTYSNDVFTYKHTIEVDKTKLKELLVDPHGKGILFDNLEAIVRGTVKHNPLLEIKARYLRIQSSQTIN